MEQAKTFAAGVLPFFDNGKTILLGKEYRKSIDKFVWNEFGGKREEGETLAYTAYREANEETANGLNVTLKQVEEAEKNGHYVDYLNPKTLNFYRMYCLFLNDKIDLSIIQENKMKNNNDNIEMVDWKYFNTLTVIIWECLPFVEEEIYSTAKIRYNLMKEKQFFKNLQLQ